MQSEMKAKISKMIYHLSEENRASAESQLREIVKMKIKDSFTKEYQKVKDSFSQESK